MANDNELLIKIKASENVSQVVKNVVDALGESNLGAAITAVGAGMAGLKATFDMAQQAIHAVSSAFQAVTKAGLESDMADRKLVQSLSLVGQYSDAAFQSMNRFATSMEEATGIEDEQTKGLMSLAMSFGMTAEQAQKASEAAINYGAATGVNAETALRQLNMTLTGSIGRMGQALPVLHSLTKAQLANGEAIDMVNAKFKDFAANQANSMSGALHHISVAYGNILEEVGKFITQNDILLDVMKGVAHALSSVANTISNLRDWFQENAQTIREWASALGAAIAIISAVYVAMNIMTIATVGLTMATTALTAVFSVLFSPIGAIILAVGALAMAFKYFNIGIEEVIGALKVLMGSILTPMTLLVGTSIVLWGKLVSIFNKDLGESLDQVGKKFQTFGINMAVAGVEQVKSTREAKAHATALEQTSTATKGLETQLQPAIQQLNRMSNAFGKATVAAKEAIDAAKGYAPSIELNEWSKNYSAFKTQLENLRNASKDIVVNIKSKGGAANPEEHALLKQAMIEQSNAEVALTALKIRNSVQIREARLKEIEITLTQQKNAEISWLDEARMKQIQSAEQIRSQRIQILYEQILQEKGIEKNALSAIAQARVNARQTELKAYEEGLRTQVDMAVSAENMKQQTLASIKQGALSGLGAGIEAKSKEDSVIIAETIRQQKLQELRNMALLSEQEYQNALTASVANQTQARMELEKVLNDERAVLLGLTPEALQARIANAQLEYEQLQQKAQDQHSKQLLSDMEYKAAKEQLELQHKDNVLKIQEDFNNRLIESGRMTDEAMAAYRQKFFADAAKSQQASLVEFMSGASLMKATQSALSSSMNAVGDAMIKSQKMNSKKMAGVFLEAFGRQVMQKGIGDMAMAIFPPNPPLMAAGAGEMAVGTAIGRVGAQMQGGQADEGMTRIPESLSGRSFILSAGERVLAPNQNRDLTAALAKINSGDVTNSNSISINVNGNADRDTVSSIKDAVIDALRESSERGRPIMNTRGLVSA